MDTSDFPLEYFGSHREPLRSYGGYAPNHPMTPATMLMGRRPAFETSTQRRDYVAHCLPTPAQTTGQNVFLGPSGFSSSKALHTPTAIEVMRAHRDAAANFYNIKSAVLPDTCGVPSALRTEMGERYRGRFSDTCGATDAFYWMNAPGSRNSGFTNGYNSINPVQWTQQDPVMDQLGRNPPDVRSNAASVSQTDYRPIPAVNYESAPIQGIMRTRHTKGTGFTTSKELRPCFLPEPCVYGHHTTSFLGDPSRYDTSYNTDFQARSFGTDISGCQILGKGPGLKTSEESPDFSLGCGPPRTFVSETRESFPSYWPLEGQRNFGLAFPVGSCSSSGFVHAVKRHAGRERQCSSNYDIDTTPQRYNPWPKFYLNHRVMIDKGYRPHPMTTGIDYAVTTSLPTTGANPDVCLY